MSGLTDRERHGGRADQNQKAGQYRSEANSLKHCHMLSPLDGQLKLRDSKLV